MLTIKKVTLSARGFPHVYSIETELGYGSYSYEAFKISLDEERVARIMEVVRFETIGQLGSVTFEKADEVDEAPAPPAPPAFLEPDTAAESPADFDPEIGF